MWTSAKAEVYDRIVTLVHGGVLSLKQFLQEFTDTVT